MAVVFNTICNKLIIEQFILYIKKIPVFQEIIQFVHFYLYKEKTTKFMNFWMDPYDSLFKMVESGWTIVTY